MVHEYTGLSFIEIEELDYIDWLRYRFDAFIYNCEQTEQGREYLDNAWRIKQTTPDRKKLRQKLKKGG